MDPLCVVTGEVGDSTYLAGAVNVDHIYSITRAGVGPQNAGDPQGLTSACTFFLGVLIQVHVSADDSQRQLP